MEPTTTPPPVTPSPETTPPTLTGEKRKAAKLTIIECLGGHCSVTEACTHANVSRQAYYKWLDEDEGFRRHVAYAQEEAVSELEGLLYTAAMRSTHDARFQRSLHLAITRRDRLRERTEDREERAKERAERARDRAEREEQRRHEQQMARHAKEMAQHEAEMARLTRRERPHPSAIRPSRNTAPVLTAPPVPPRLHAPADHAEPALGTPAYSGDGHASAPPNLHPRS